MSDFEPDGGSEGPWDEQGDLAWTEFDWERYLRGQDEAVSRYLRHYEAARGQPDRIDVAAEKMGWGGEGWYCIADAGHVTVRPPVASCFCTSVNDLPATGVGKV